MMNENNYIKDWESLFLRHRPFLVSFAFRMTGSLSEAEDIVQDTFIACNDVDPKTIENHKSWLTKVCSNRGIDHMKSAYKKRESYTGTWLPDAIPDSYQIWESLGNDKTPDKNILLSESLTTSFLLLLERLNPEERAVYLLSEIFEYTFKEIADFIDKTESACRKIAQRAREAILAEKARFTNITSNAKDLINQFFESAKKGDKDSLLNLLSEDSQFWSDGGGKVSAVGKIVMEPLLIAKFFAHLGSSSIFHGENYKGEYSMVNGLPGFTISVKLPTGEWAFETIMSFEIKDNKITRIYAQRNPDKFQSLVKA